MWIVCITSVRHVLTVNGYGGRQTKENEKSWCFKGWETLVRYIPNQYTIIISISYFYSYHEMSIFQGINAYKDWSVYLYEYDKGRISKVHRYASCWGDREAEEYNFVYDNNILCAIVGEKRLKNGELDIHWKNKKVYNKES